MANEHVFAVVGDRARPSVLFNNTQILSPRSTELPVTNRKNNLKSSCLLLLTKVMTEVSEDSFFQLSS